MIRVQDNWEAAFEASPRAEVEALLPAFLMSSRWFGGKARTIRSARFSDVLRVDKVDRPMILGFIEVSYTEGGVETYSIPMTAAFEAEADRINREHPQAILSALNIVHPWGELSGILYDALWNEGCVYSLLTSMGRRAQFQGSSGIAVGSSTAVFDEAAIGDHAAAASVLTGEQSNTSVKFGDRVIVKLYRRIEPGINPELEVGRTLTARHFTHSPSVIGALEYVQEAHEPTTLALAQIFVPNQGNAWDYTLAQLSSYFDHLSALDAHPKVNRPHEADQHSRSMNATDFLLGYVNSANLLGRRTGELHLALGQPGDENAFTPEICTSSYVQSRIQTMQQSATRAFTLLRGRLSTLSKTDQEKAHKVLGQEPSILNRLGILAGQPVTALRIRCHGDYHLGQVLYTGGDFVIIDFEGEPAKPLTERRTKHLPTVDLAGMIRSFHYAAHVALRKRTMRHPDAPSFMHEAEQWYGTACTAFLKGYRTTVAEANFSPPSRQEFNLLLDVHILDKALYELTYELNNRPDWVGLPLTGILQCVEASLVIDDEDDLEHAKTPGPSLAAQPRDEVNQ